MTNADKSLGRAKKSTVSLAEIGVKEGLGLLLPGGGLIYSVGKVLFEHGKRYMQDRNEARIDEFNRLLLAGMTEEESEPLLHTEFSIEDYCSLLSSAIADDEDAKLQFYSQLFKTIILGKIEATYKLHILKCVKELTSTEINFLRELYISSRHDFKGPNSASAQVKALTVTSDPLKNVSLQKLSRMGMLIHSEKEKCLVPTKILDSMVSSLYQEEQLTPKAIGKIAWRNYFIPTFYCDLTKREYFATRISQLCNDLDVRTTTAAVRRELTPFYPHPVTILGFDKADDAAVWEEFGEKIRGKQIVKVYLMDADGEEPIDFLPRKEAAICLPLRRNCAEDFHRLKEALEAILPD